MSVKRETRTGEVRAVLDDGQVEVLAVAYGVVDDYGSLWLPGVFAADLEKRMPTMAWAHDWSEPIGRAVASREAPEGLYLTFRLDVGGAVPRADQAHEQFRSGTVDDVSVGFYSRERRDPTDVEREAHPGVTQVEVRADLDETSPVLRGAVPGAKVLAVRDARGQIVPEDSLVAMAKRVHAGELTVDEAKVALDLLAVDDGGTVTGDGTGEALPPVPDLDAAAVIAEAETILDRSR